MGSVILKMTVFNHADRSSIMNRHQTPEAIGLQEVFHKDNSFFTPFDIF